MSRHAFIKMCHFLYAPLKQSVMIAMPEQPTVAAAQEVGFGAAFGIKLHELEAVACDIGHERDGVFLRHGMIRVDDVFILDRFDRDIVCRIRCFGFKRRQRDAAARDHGFADGVDDVAADGADVNACTQEIRRAVCIRDAFAREQFWDRDV